MISKIPAKLCNFFSLKGLLDIIKSETSFKLQVYSLEAFELFEKFLKINKISYNLNFTSTFKHKPGLNVLLKDSEGFEFKKNSKIILYSNSRDRRFTPYKFTVNAEEKNLILNYEVNKGFKESSVTSIIRSGLDINKYTPSSLNQLQSTIIFCLIRVSNFRKLIKELQSVDNSINNSFEVQMELNWLVKMRICKKSGNSYKVNLPKSTIKAICESIQFNDALC